MADLDSLPPVARVHASLVDQLTGRASGGAVSIDREVLGDDRLPGLWSAVLRTPRLRVEHAVVSDLGPTGAFEVTGRMPVLGFGTVAVRLDVFAPFAGWGLDVVLTVTDVLASWSLSDDLTDLPSYLDAATGQPVASFLHAITLPHVGLAFSSYDFRRDSAGQPTIAAAATSAGHAFAPGLTFDATFDPTGHGWLDTVRSAAGLSGPLTLRGALVVESAGSLLELRLPCGAGASVTLGRMVLHLDEIVVVSGLTATSGAPPAIWLLGRVTTTAGDFPVSVETLLGDPAVRISGGDDDHLLPLDDVASALGFTGADLTPGIANTSVLGDVGLARIELDAGLSPARLDAFDLVLTTKTPWTLLGGKVSFEPVVAISGSVDATGAADTKIELSGRWMVAGQPIRVAFSPTSGAFTAELEAGNHLDAGSLLSGLGLSGHPTIDVAVPEVRIWGNTTDGSFNLELTAGDVLDLRCGRSHLRLQDVRFFLAHDASGDRWELAGALTIAGVHLKVAAELDAGGWVVDARGWMDDPIDLGAVADAVLREFHGDGQHWPAMLPEGYARLTVRQVVLQYDQSDRSMELFVDLETDLHVLPDLELTHLTVSIAFDDAGLVAASVAAAVHIAGVEIDLEATQDREHGLVFRGHTAPGATLPLGVALAAELSSLAGTDIVLPAAVADCSVTGLAVSFAPATGHFSAELHGALPSFHAASLDVKVDVARRQAASGAASDVSFAGRLHVGTITFDLDLGHDGARTELVASLSGDAAGVVDVAALAAAITGSLAAKVPSGLSLEIDEIFLLHETDAQRPPQTVVAVALTSSIDLTALPLIGSLVHDTLEISLQPVVLAAPATAEDLTRLSRHLPAGPLALPPGPLGAGLHLESRLRGGSIDLRLGLPLAVAPNGDVTALATAPPGPVAAPAATTDGTKWFRIDRQFGPIALDRIGVGFAAGRISATLDGSLQLGGLRLELIDPTVSTALSPIAPSFSLHGIALDYRSGGTEIGGTFLRETVTPTTGPSYDEYGGRVVVATSSFGLAALGLYAEFDGAPSLFVYGVLNKPLGGPTCFFVTGLALGFGYNRELIPPAVADVADFPLVREATGTLAPKASLRDELTQLGSSIRPRDGEMFLAVGIKFNSFKLIDSFVLAVVQFGRRLEIDVLGVSTAVIPPPESGVDMTPLAEIQVALSARIVPDEGTLTVRAQLTSATYLLSRSCRLTGGFAFSAWFGTEHNGEFVATLGGYHPLFTPPSYYPVVPKLELNWPVDDHLVVKGGAYFALTGAAVMAGAHLGAVYRNGSLAASFDAGIDLLLGWKPFYYDARLHIAFALSYTFELFGTHHLDMSISADLEIWGPDFAGRATIDIGVASVSVLFGARTKSAPIPIGYDTFATSFLPVPAQMCTITLVSGLMATVTDNNIEYWVVHPKDVVITVQSAFPVNDPHAPQIAVGPVALAGSALSSALTVDIDGDDDDEFAREPLRRGVPTAMWGDKVVPAANSPAMLDDIQVGWTLRPAQPPVTTTTAPLPASELDFDTEVHTYWSIAPEVPVVGQPETWGEADWSSALADASVARRRRGIAASWGFSARDGAGPGADLAEHFLADPLVLAAPSAAPIPPGSF